MTHADPNPAQNTTISQIISGGTCYGTDTSVSAAKHTAEEMFHARILFGGEFEVRWHEESDGTWTLLAIDDDADPDENGLYTWWATGVRVHTGPHTGICPLTTTPHHHDQED